MTVAAFVLAVLAVLAFAVSLASVYFVRSQATVNIDRRHDELDRQWDATIVPIANTPSHQLNLRLLGPRDVDSVFVEIVDARGLSFANGQPHVPDGSFPQDARHPALRQGALATWVVSLGADRATPAHVRVTSTKGEETWSCMKNIDVPIDLTRSFWP
jgi:hypothetical protein